jgi:hypothetical protein
MAVILTLVGKKPSDSYEKTASPEEGRRPSGIAFSSSAAKPLSSTEGEGQNRWPRYCNSPLMRRAASRILDPQTVREPFNPSC